MIAERFILPAAIALAAIIVAAAGRYEIAVGPGVFRLDRLTGEVDQCLPGTLADRYVAGTLKCQEENPVDRPAQ